MVRILYISILEAGIVLEIRNLSKTYNNKVIALKNVSLTLNKGEFAMVLGLSGAGKSTLIRSINGLISVEAGSIKFEGVSVSNKENVNKIRKDIGIIFQQFNIIKRLTVLENVLCGRLAYSNTIMSSLKLFKKKDINWALDCIERVGLKEKTYVRSDQLSGGQQQRVAIARALAQKPKLILADEPVASLDPYSAVEILELLTEINKKEKITMLMSLHNLELAKEYGQRTLGIKNGMLIFDKQVSGLTEEEIQLIYTMDTPSIVK